MLAAVVNAELMDADREWQTQRCYYMMIAYHSHRENTMTFTVLGVCERTRKIGVCKTTGTPLGGGRSIVVIPGKGALTVQAHTSFRLMTLASKLFEVGYSPSKILRELEDSDPHADYRQIGIIDSRGHAVAKTGSKTRPWSGHVIGKNCVAAGNVIVGQKVVQAMADSFENNAAEDLEERLLRSIEAGCAAGGQPNGQTSAALLVHESYDFPIINLRVDVALDPVKEIRKIFDWYRPLIPHYIKRNTDPTSVTNWKDTWREKGWPVNPYA